MTKSLALCGKSARAAAYEKLINDPQGFVLMVFPDLEREARYVRYPE